MVTPISSLSSLRPTGFDSVQRSLMQPEVLLPFALEADSSLKPLTAVSKDERAEVQEKFQEFMAGTFYAQMVKSLRAGQGKPAYFHGGQAEEIFQSQMDQIVSTNLAKSHGAEMAEPLFRAYLQQRGESAPDAPGKIDISI